jgi:hypothetical protein
MKPLSKSLRRRLQGGAIAAAMALAGCQSTGSKKNDSSGWLVPLADDKSLSSKANSAKATGNPDGAKLYSFTHANLSRLPKPKFKDCPPPIDKPAIARCSRSL